MATLTAKKRLQTVQINNQIITVEPRETVLQAALRQGLDFPHSCRVGGCGSCKCRLAEGKVKELTETGYLLTADELEQGYILACQSVPQTDLRIDVELTRGPPGTRGRVVGQQKVTHDITRLTIELEQPLSYKAGQFANVSIAGLDVVRSYSFATPARQDGQVSFLIRRVPGGQLSSLVNDDDLVGRAAMVDGPHGNFWLRASGAPMLLVAGGSGLAPILALLEQAVEAGTTRDATLLFGAREARDLYALDQLASIAKRWRGTFRFVPVLSAEPVDSSWQGERGLVTDKLRELMHKDSEAYLCGPPGMIDGSLRLLKEASVPREHIHDDRFTTQADLAAEIAASDLLTQQEPISSPIVDVLHYLKYFLFHLVGLFSLMAILAGGFYATAGLLEVLAFYIIGDAISGDDTTTPKYKYPQLLTAQLWLALPLLASLVFASVWSVCSGDPLGFGAWVGQWSGYDVISARDATSFAHHVSTGILTGLLIGMVGTVTAHELTHRTWDATSMLIGRWLLAFSFDTSFAIEHVYGHHRYVSTLEDPATAPRGRNVYFHMLASTVKGNLSAWRIEADRLGKKRLGLFSYHNAVIRGHLMSVTLVLAAYAMGGLDAALYFTLCGLWGKGLLEIVNYMEHYGMVRNPETPVQPRHSWNTNRRISSWSMFNLTRHSHHHAQGEVPYQDLRPFPDAPMMISGYLTTLVIAMVPPLWHLLMTPKVLAWDREFASEEERRLAARANARSGLAPLKA